MAAMRELGLRIELITGPAVTRRIELGLFEELRSLPSSTDADRLERDDRVRVRAGVSTGAAS
ncbi:MAG: hypothetical protein AAF533_05845 [Acidobacteriota bacterium]